MNGSAKDQRRHVRQKIAWRRGCAVILMRNSECCGRSPAAKEINFPLWDSTRLLKSIFSGICRQNTQFNMYSTTSKQQEGCMFKDSHPKCFITTTFDKFPREAVAKGGESWWCFDSMFPWYTKSKVNSNGVCNYYDFIRRDGLSLAMWQLFDIVQSAFG